MELTKHLKKMLEERSIRTEWTNRAPYKPQQIEDHDDGTRHYLCQIEEHGGRWLRVIVNTRTRPERAITALSDRRIGSTP